MGGKSSSSSDSGPWAGTQPYLKDVYAQAQGLFNQGTPAYYPGQTYTDFNQIQQGAMDATMNRSGGSAAEGSLSNMLNRTMNQPGVSLAPGQATATHAMSGLATGMDTAANHTNGMDLGASRFYADQGTGGWNDQLWKQSQYNGGPDVSSGPQFANTALQANADPMSMSDANEQAGSSQALNATAKSRLQNLTQGNNPYLDDMAKAATDSVREQFSESVMPSLNATFSMGGRTGSRAHTDAVGKASEGLADTISNMTSDIYGSNYQSDMDRKLQAADSLGNLEVNEFSANSSDDIARRGLGADLYLGSRGLSNDAASTALSDNLGRESLGKDYDINRRNLAQDATSTGMNAQLARNDMMSDWYNSGANRALDASGMLMDTSMGAIDDMTQMFGTQGQLQLGAGSQVGDLSDMQWANIDRMRGVGDDVQGLSDAMLEDDINRFNYYQNAPWQNLMRYAGIIGDNAMMSNSSDSGGWSLQF